MWNRRKVYLSQLEKAYYLQDIWYYYELVRIYLTSLENIPYWSTP